MMTRRSWFVYGTLLAIWILLLGWQAAEHGRVKRAAQSGLLNRSREISNTLGLLMRTQHFFGIINKERIETALNELVDPKAYGLHPTSIEVLNLTNEVVASAGPPIDPNQLAGELPLWDDQARTLTLMNPVDLGTNLLMSWSEVRTNRPPPSERFDTNSPARPPSDSSRTDAPTAPVPTSEFTNASTTFEPTNSPPRRRGLLGRRRPGGTNELGSFERPSWMKEEEYNTLIQKKGIHGFLIVMPTDTLVPVLTRDLWLRAFIGMLGTVAVAGFALAYRNVDRTSELQIRLVRASEMNSHLKGMNLAAAGLAHETRNPLNIVRGLAQMISKQPDVSPEIRDKSREIINETDRVTAQLNEFINYSRPREVRRAAANLNSIVAEVARALNYDLEEKKVQLQVVADPLIIEADEQLLRQALFNLVINAIQAVPANGEIQVRAGKRDNSEVFVEIADDGPGIAPEHRSEIFKPYFTTNQKGTGLGLAVVQQIVLAHGWEIECVNNQPSGAIFRITHIKPAFKS